MQRAEVKFIMDRKTIEQSFDTKDGKITSPGMYEGMPMYAPAYYNFACLDLADGTIVVNGTVRHRFDLDEADYHLWPELKPFASLVIGKTREGKMEVLLSDRMTNAPGPEKSP